MLTCLSYNLKTIAFKFPLLESAYNLCSLAPIKFDFVLLVTQIVPNTLAKTRQTGSV